MCSIKLGARASKTPDHSAHCGVPKSAVESFELLASVELGYLGPQEFALIRFVNWLIQKTRLGAQLIDLPFFG